MSREGTVTIDESPAGSWRRALDPEGTCCAACGQNECRHSDLEYQGVVPIRARPERERAA